MSGESFPPTLVREDVPAGSERPSSLEYTVAGPTCPELLSAGGLVAPVPAGPLGPGDRIDDFEILGVLGKGAFGVVYLARQVSLDRQVALKVSDARGREGRNMAQLEHAHIVQVFSETLDASGRRRLLCMQYVPGPTLAAVLERIGQRDRREWSGAALVEIVDALTPFAASFDPAALRNRELLQRCDWTEAVCWIGARLAEALDYAHRHGVLHRDVKPGNILVSQYGRPMLVDFNLAFRPLEAPDALAGLFGGTLAYMAPEHLDAFNPEGPAGPEAVGPAADLYSLGMVLYEMLAGRRPLDDGPAEEDEEAEPARVLRALAAKRRRAVPSLPAEHPPALRQAIARCLHPDPAGRYASGAEMSAALDGCREYVAAERAVPRGGRLAGLVARRPFRWLVLLGLLPNLAASAVQISYNQVRIISHLTEAQQKVFLGLLSYNLVYLVCVWQGLRIALPVYRVWRDLAGGAGVDPRRADAARALSLTWPAWAAWLSGAGWGLGGVVFPLGLAVFSGPVGWQVIAHLATSFVISGLIALVYSFLFVQCLEVCVVYRRLWADAREFGARAAAELGPVLGRLRPLQVLAGLIPLAGAVLMVAVGPQEFTADEYRSFRLLVTALIALGMAGFQLALVVTGVISRAVTALTEGGRVRV